MLSPYQSEYNPQLKGNTIVRYIFKKFKAYEYYRFDFTQTFNNLFNKGLTKKGRLEIRLKI
jgi:hypothetical protein